MAGLSPRHVATVHALGRLAIGTALTLQPRHASAAWVGREAARPASQVLAAAMGARDAAIGAGLLRTLRLGEDVRPWVAAGVVSDFVDLVATVRAARHLPPAAVAGICALAAGSSAAGAWVYAASSRSP